jgi:cation:H+ antiporter
MDLGNAGTLLVLVVLVAALAALITSAKLFTGAAERVGLALGLSPFTVGVFIIALGTSLPELVAAVLAVLQGTSEVVSGNVLGANTANLLLLLGVVASVTRRGIQLDEQYIAIDLNFMLGSAALLSLVMLDGTVGRLEGTLLLAGYAVYTGYLLTEGRSATAEADFVDAVGESRAVRVQPRDLLLLAGAGAGIYLSAGFTLDALLALAPRLGLSPAIASLTILSLGTTLPELAVSVAAARAGRPEMAVGNILGSCIFNAFGVVGIASFVGPVAVPGDILRLPLPAFIGSAILFYLLTQDRRVSRWEGMLFVLAYLLLLAELAGLT